MTARALFAPSIALIVSLASAGLARIGGQDDGDRSTTAAWWPEWLFDRGIIQLTEGEGEGKLGAVVPMTNPRQLPERTLDAHGLRVRCRKGR